MIHKTYDPEVDAFYISCKKGAVAKTVDKGKYLVDYDAEGNIMGYEVLNYSVNAERLDIIDGISLLPREAVILKTKTNFL
jgi:uncharacterized protein YuzE